jgi:glucosamine--fructose-6-phosphate aminotransferase (isomerizing)
MCGIVGYIGKKKTGTDIVLAGLTALEYRGYDSAGMAFLGKNNELLVDKQVGRVQGLQDSLGQSGKFPASNTVIGHTRWATHGGPSMLNAHPHFNADNTIAVAHNGIIENHHELRQFLEDQGYEFMSDTDTEVVPHLIDHYLKESRSLQAAIEKALSQLRGAYAILVMSSKEPDTLFTVRLSSPLVVGIAPGEIFIASDATALLEHTKEVIYPNDHELAVLHKDGTYQIKDLKKSTAVIHKTQILDYDLEQSQLGDYPNYMLKEMHEVPATIKTAITGRLRLDTNTVKLGGLENVADQLQYIDRIVIVACGTSYYAGLVGEYLIEELAGIPVEVQLASEFKYRNEPFSRGTALLAISQSGETADTIAALKKVENYGVLRLGVVNAVGSTIARMTDAGVYCHAGPEKAVASTKAFAAQVSVLTLIALHLSKGHSPLFKPILQELATLPEKAAEILAQEKTIKKYAKKYKNAKDFLFIGRTYGYPCALEGALKLKEISYIHAEAYAAGEMKHGPLAMIDKNFPTLAIATDSPMLEKTLSNMQEIAARKGPLLAIATEGNKSVEKVTSDVIYIPKSLEQTQPILVVLAEQMLAYHVAIANGHDVDRPRNLAKSVTVE